MRYINIIDNYDWDDLSARIYNKNRSDVEVALNKVSQLNADDFMALISPAASDCLERMAAMSQLYTRQRFGKTIQFYVPLYLTNACVNHCVYCGFSRNNAIHRVILSDDEILREVEAIKSLGDFQHVLLVTGENPRKAGLDYIRNAIRLVKPHFASISIEVQPLTEEEYRLLAEAGMTAVYCYQETYHKRNYKIYHPKGVKSDFNHRLDAFDRMGLAGVHKIGLGVLIGLEDWRADVTMLALHLRYMQKNYWRTKYSISFPRMRPHEGESFRPNVVMTQKELAQLIFAFRIFDHDVELALSTREDQCFRDNMTALGITSMSAGSKTDPGGYAVYRSELEQFAVSDERHPSAVVRAVNSRGYDVIWKDWDQALQ